MKIYNKLGSINLILTLYFMILSISISFGQECGNEFLGQTFNQNSGTRSGCDDVTGMSQSYIIPVAIHVIRDDFGEGNWPDDDIVQHMLNRTNDLLAPHFTLVPIQNPNNNCGITFRPEQRFHTIDENNELQIKNLSRIDPNLVCNIWMVRNVENGTGFAWLPSGSGWSESKDGIVIEKETINLQTLAHEFGHYLDLHHVWGDGDHASRCHGPSEGCTAGDFVEDTPRCNANWPVEPGWSNLDCSYNVPNWTNINTQPWCVHGDPIPCDNIMNYGFNRRVLTPGQRDRMIYTLNNFRPNLGAYSNSCLVCENPCEPCYYGTPPIDPSTYNPLNDFCSPCHEAHEHLNVTSINGVVNITQPTLITEDLTVYGTLNVNSDLFVAPGKSITLHQASLNVGSQGHITACSDSWQGIYSYRGYIQIKDGGTISKAKLAITSVNQNTTLRCNGAFFYDNDQDVILTGNDNASFNSTVFIGSRNGVQLFGLENNTTFTECTFAYQSGSGISTNYGSSISVLGNNLFTGCGQAISLENFFGTASTNFIGSSEASANQFTNCYNGVRSVNSTSEIWNNYFDNNNYGLVMRGLNKFTSNNNSYSGSSYAEAIDGTGFDSNQSFGNQYSSTEGIYPHNSNNGYVFYDNCFSTLWWDVNALGVINQAQFGNGDRAAGNCFTHGGVTDFICDTGVPVVYGIPEGVASECLYPDNTGGWNYTIEPSIYIGGVECGAQFVSDNQYGYLIRMGCDEKRLKKSTDSLKLIVAKIKVIIKDRPLTKSEKVMLAKAERHLRFAIAQWAWCLRKEGRLRELKEWYKIWSKEFPGDKYYAINMAEVTANLGQFIASKAELDSISIVHSIDIDILQSLKMCIDVLQSTEQRNISFSEENTMQENTSSFQSNVDGSFISGYQLTPANHELLRRVSRMIAPEAAYGRALLSYLTGEKIDPVSAITVNNRSKPTGQIKTQVGEIYRMNPNPAAHDITLDILHQDNNSKYQYALVSITGVQAAQGEINGVTNINISTIDNGVYIMRIIKDNMTVDIKKLVIQK